MRDTLGLSRKAPDEFVVYSRPPLSVPPEFELAPPQPGAPPLTPSTEDIARETLLGGGDKPFKLDGAEATDETEGTEEEPRFTTLKAPETAVEPIESGEAPSGATSTFLNKVGANEASPDIRQQLGEDSLQEPERKEEAESLYEQLVGGDDEPVVDAFGEAERLRENKDKGKPVTEGETPTEDEKEKSVIDQIF